MEALNMILDFFKGPLNDFAWMYTFLPCAILGGLFLTIRNGGVQFVHFGHAMKNTVGKMFQRQKAGEGAVTPLQAVTTALAATVGTGNIVGTSQAIAMGGYGAVFWLWLAALVGMVIKYSEIVLAIKYRERDDKGDWVGGPMYYISKGLGRNWKWLAALFAIFASLASFGIGNMSQVNSITGSVIGACAAFTEVSSGMELALKWIMGILLAILVPILLLGRLDNIYMQLMLVSTMWLGLIGGLDDYIKVFRHHKEGLKGRFKIVGQVGLGLIVGTTMWISEEIVVREKSVQPVETVYCDPSGEVVASTVQRVVLSSESLKTTQTTIPFIKNNELDYSWFTGGNDTAAWLLYVLVAILVITAVSNGANLTDGLDGLVTGVSVPIVVVLGAMAYLSGHIVYADYLNIMYIPQSGELLVFAAATAGALIGFLWYNSFPAQIFMGDTGSLSIGGIIAVFALCIRKELLLPLLCGVFLVESLSVMMQVSYFKYTKRKYGEGRRILLMSPVHHHYQKRGIFETKIVTRFWIVSLLLAAVTLVTLKIR